MHQAKDSILTFWTNSTYLAGGSGAEWCAALAYTSKAGWESCAGMTSGATTLSRPSWKQGTHGTGVCAGCCMRRTLLACATLLGVTSGSATFRRLSGGCPLAAGRP